MSREFKGRPVLPGICTGEALVSRSGFNTLASFQKSLVARSKIAVCSDQNNPDLYQRVMTGKILCLPVTIGSPTGGLALQTAARQGCAPIALLFSEHIDPLAAAGVILADIWDDVRLVVIDQLGPEFLPAVNSGDTIHVSEDGTVEVS